MPAQKRFFTPPTLILTALLLGLGVLILGGGGVVLAWQQAGQGNRYPGAELTHQRYNLRALPRHALLVQTYRTHDPLWEVYDWYKQERGLLPPTLAHDGCVHLRGAERTTFIENRVTVIICETPPRPTIMITRLTSVN